MMYHTWVMRRIKYPGIDLGAGIGSAIAAFALYLSTLAPTLSWGWRGLGVDGGELLAAAHSLGVPHPSGYPTYMLLLKGFGSVVAIGDFAFRGNLASAFLGAVTVGLLYWLTLLLARAHYLDAPTWLLAATSSFAALTFAATPLLWSQAVITEVYTLNTVFVGALAVLATHIVLGRTGGRADEGRVSHGSLAAFGVITGLGLGNHLTLLAIAAPLALWIALRRRPGPAAVAWGIAGLAAGLSIYVYLPIRAAANPPVNWGDASSAGGFFWMLSGQAYQDYVFGVPFGSIGARLADWVDLVFTQLNPLGLFLALTGMAALAKAEGWFLSATVLSILGLFGYAISYNTFDSAVLTIPAFLLLSAYSGLGLLTVITSVSGWASESADRGLASGSTRRFMTGWMPLAALLAVAFVAVPLGSVAFNYSSQNLRDDRRALEIAEAAMDMMPPGSVVLTEGEARTFALWYVAFVERPESGIVPIAARLLQFDWYGPSLNDRYPGVLPSEWPADTLTALERIIENSSPDRGVYMTYYSPDLAAKYTLSLQPHGLYRVDPK